MNCRSLTEPSRCTRNDTSASSGVLWSGRGQRRNTCPTMFCRYSGNGNSTPSVLTLATSLPVDGVSPGSGAVFDVVRGAASRLVVSAVLGGAAFETVLLGGGFAVANGAAFCSAGRSTAAGALRSSSVGAGSAIYRTLYVGVIGLLDSDAEATRHI